MNIRLWIIAAIVLLVLLGGGGSGRAEEDVSSLEKSMSNTLDTWRDARYEELFDQLAHRGKTSREAFVKIMGETTVRPACCWQKMEHFKVINEKSTETTVYVKIGLEGTPASPRSITREFKLTYQEGVWKMRMADIFSIAGVTVTKRSGTKRHKKKTYLNLN